ncbi:MAG: amidohydrolase [Bdellovibrionales bacterium]|nr:amidohydrolase [Bdellovibrionales bacterium]
MTILLSLYLLLPLTSFGAEDKSFIDLTALSQELKPLYEQLHQNPELSFHEEKTAAIFATELKKAGFQTTVSFGGWGVVGILKNNPGPTLMLRTDLDALPIEEETGLAFASKQKQSPSKAIEVGVMHACGHDLHITNMIGVARVLAQNRARWHGTVMIIGQPAEEKGAGARLMLDAGLFKKFPKPDYALALHVDASERVGKVTLLSGPITANVDSVDIIMKGRGGHGANPQQTIDPIPMTSELVLALQTLISREKDPSEPAVLTVGSFHSGSKHNIISNSAHLQLTVRTFTKETRENILEGIKRKARAIATSYQAPEPEITMSEEPVPSVVNDSKLVARLRPVFIKILGENNILAGRPWMVGEDFSRYGLAGVPSVLFALGSLSESRLEAYKKKGHVPSLHSSTYFPSPVEAMRVGINLMAESAITLLND